MQPISETGSYWQNIRQHVCGKTVKKISFATVVGYHDISTFHVALYSVHESLYIAPLVPRYRFNLSFHASVSK